jgi:hypothetical protein
MALLCGAKVNEKLSKQKKFSKFFEIFCDKTMTMIPVFAPKNHFRHGGRGGLCEQ